MSDRREHGPNLNAMVIQFHQIYFSKFKRNKIFVHFFKLKHPKLQKQSIQILKIFKPRLQKL